MNAICSIGPRGFSGGASGKEPTCQCRRHKRCGFSPWIGKIPWRRAWQSTPVLMPGESQGQRSLSPWGSKESDMTEATSDTCTQLDLQIIILREINQKKRQIPYDITYLWNLKYDANKIIYETERYPLRKQTCGCYEENG